MTEFIFDHRRRDRIGLDEAVFCAGKSAGQIDAVIDDLKGQLQGLLFTRLDPRKFAELTASHRALLDYDPVSHTAILGQKLPLNGARGVAIVMAGTSDAPMGREAARTLAFNGQAVREFTDVGVAGLWRLMERIDEIRQAPVVIVAAGMDAALISVVGGLFAGPVIGLPTSVGYGVANGGTTALRAGLASCAPGVTMVNIDNGYGAACAALRAMNVMRLASAGRET